MISFQRVYYSYFKPNWVLNNISMEISPGLTLVLGPNGCGKSTFLKTLAGVERPDSGSIEIDGLNLWTNEAAARRDLAFVPEQPDLTPYASVKDVISLVCRLRHEPMNKGREVLKKVELEHVSRRTIRELSMGQRRRVVLAAAWIGSPKIVLLDEPLESMDRTIRENILSWVDELIERNATILIVTHEIEPFVLKASRAMMIRAGQCKMYNSLPLDAKEKLHLLDRLGRGM